MDTASSKVLIIDDDRSLRRALKIGLTARGYEVVEAQCGIDGVTQVSLTDPDAVVLDLGLPDLDGQEVCRRIRQWSDVPVIVLSAAGSEERKVAVLDAGADDYITKPFGMAELEARLRVVLRREAKKSSVSTPDQLHVGSISIDLVHRMVLVEGQAIDLTAKELDLLAFLALHQGKTCTHQMILAEVWGSAYATESQYLRVYAHKLRRKLGSASGALKTRPGVGYELTP